MMRLCLSFVLITHLVAGQSGDACRENYKNAMAEYRSANYQKSFEFFRKTDQCTLSPSEYYNGACIASLAGNSRLATKYLTTAVKLGFENLAHMQQDKDLDAIRTTKDYGKVVKMIETKYDTIVQRLSGLANLENTSDAIPYYKNERWGWMHRSTHQPLTEPLFTSVDFRTLKGLRFTYYGKNFIYTPEHKIELVQRTSGDIAVMMDSDIDMELPHVRGFTVERGGSVSARNERYSELIVVGRSAGGEYVGIAKSKDADVYGVVKENGDTLKAFPFVFSSINSGSMPQRQYYLVARKQGDDFYMMYDLDGNTLFPQPIQQHRPFDVYHRTKANNDEFVGFIAFRFSRVRMNNKWYVIEHSLKKAINSTGYDDILYLSGPNADEDRRGTAGSGGVLTAYFLARDGNDFFFFDKGGAEYRVR